MNKKLIEDIRRNLENRIMNVNGLTHINASWAKVTNLKVIEKPDFYVVSLTGKFGKDNDGDGEKWSYEFECSPVMIDKKTYKELGGYAGVKKCKLCGKAKEQSELLGRFCTRCDSIAGDVIPAESA